ncbi:MutS-like protein [Asimina triloba]
MARIASNVSADRVTAERANFTDPCRVVSSFTKLQLAGLHSRSQKVNFRNLKIGHRLDSRLSLTGASWHIYRKPHDYAFSKEHAILCFSTGTHNSETTVHTQNCSDTSRPLTYLHDRDQSGDCEAGELFDSILSDHPATPERTSTYASRGLCDACKFVHNDAKFVNERARNDIILLSRGITRLNNRARQDVAILGLGFLKLDARAREDTEKIDHGVKKKAARLHDIAMILKDKASTKLKRVADQHWSDGALEADLRRADFLVKRRAMEDAFMALEVEFHKHPSLDPGTPPEWMIHTLQSLIEQIVSAYCPANFVRNIHDMMVSKMYQIPKKQGPFSVNNVMGLITLEKNGKALDFFPGEVSTDRITAIQVWLVTLEAYWGMASALSEADGIDYTDPEELELLVATLIDLDAMDGKSSVSLLAECSSSPDDSTRQALANALAAAPSMWTLGNAGMGALQRLAEDSNPVVAAAASKAIAELKRQWEIEEGDSWRFTMGNSISMPGTEGDEKDNPSIGSLPLRSFPATPHSRLYNFFAFPPFAFPPSKTLTSLSLSLIMDEESSPEHQHNKLPELKLDARQAQGFISFFKTLPHDDRAVRFFDRRVNFDSLITALGHNLGYQIDYYTAHGENATFIAKTYYHTTTALRQLGSGSNGLSSVSVSKNMFENIARDLLLDRADHTLEVYEGSGSNWRLSRTGTPGNIGSFEDILFANNDMQDSPAMVALCTNFRENECKIGLSYVDMTKRTLGLVEFLDDSQFTILESALVALGCKECLVPLESGKSTEKRTLHDAIARCGVLLTERKKLEFKTRDLVQDLSRLVKGSIEPVRDLISNFQYASGALGALLSYAELLADETNYGKYFVREYNLGSYMRLDSAAMRALNVLESKTDANKNFSLFGLMNRTCTAGMGKRLLNRWLKQPLLDVDDINCRLDLVQAFVEDTVLRHDLRQHLKRISDIERLVHNLGKSRAVCLSSSIRLPYIKSSLQQHEGQFSSLIKRRYLDPLESLTDDEHLNRFIGLVEASIDLDLIENGEYMIAASYDKNLSILKNKREEAEQQIHSLHKQTANDLDLPIDKALKLDKGTQFGHVFRITKKEEPKIRKKLSSHFIVLETRKDGVKFTNTKLKKLGDQYLKLVEEYMKCQKMLVDKVVQTVATFSEDEGDIVLKGSRHPCVEAQDGVNFIPNDCTLVGVNVLMAQVGCFVPCDQASISVRDCIFTRVGAGDCQLRGVSTFMQEMLETASILKGATDKSLIIIDELGRGTSTYDGFGLAWAICEHLVEVTRAPTLFATHFHELTALANEDVGYDNQRRPIHGVANYHVGAHIDSSSHKLTMLYKVEAGACDQSFGIHVAEFANFPQEVVELAREKAAELEDFSSAPVISNVPKVGSKRQYEQTFSPDDTARGVARAHKFLQEFSALPLDQMDLKEALQEVGKMRRSLERVAAEYPWLQQFF